nr:MAG TPA: hypothetical protein [Caudoviricetes sp.]
MKSIPLQFKKIAVGAYVVSLMTGVLIALVFAACELVGPLGVLPFIPITIINLRWVKDIERADREALLKSKRSRKSIGL